MYFTMCSMLMMYFKMAMQHSGVWEILDVTQLGSIQTFSIMIFMKEHLS